MAAARAIRHNKYIYDTSPRYLCWDIVSERYMFKPGHVQRDCLLMSGPVMDILLYSAQVS